MAQVAFDPEAFKASYPAFAAVADPTISAQFMNATLYLDNGDASAVQDIGQRTALYNLIVAHLLTMSGALDASGQASGIVGPIKSATEGSTSVTAALGDLSGDELFWLSTPYGLAYWNATSALRSAIYVPGPQPFTGVLPYGAGGYWQGRTFSRYG